MPAPEKFNDSLKEFDVSDKIIAAVNDGYDGIISSTPKKVKAAYFKRAIDIMERELEFPVMRDVLEYNGCCKSGAREKASKAFAKENAALTLSEKLAKFDTVANMGTAVLNDDGTITATAVTYFSDGKFNCACSNFNKVKRDYAVSKNYCLCCAGHFKHHYQIMLGVKLTTLEIISSPLDSDGKNPCVIKFAVCND